MGVWGANIARTGIAVHSAEEFPPEIADALEKVFVPYFDMLLRWYGALHVGANCGDVYEAVREYMEDPFFGIALNAGHLIRDEEWINAPFVPGSKDVLASGTMIQCDIIVPATPPYPGVHTEDGLVVADADLGPSWPGSIRRFGRGSRKGALPWRILATSCTKMSFPSATCRVRLRPSCSAQPRC